MGLAGRKEKQRIGPDPRNLTWAQDNSRFGQQYLAKFGWTPDSGSGLGANGDGRLAHISVAQKLNLLGIGGPTAGTNNPDAIAWKQNKEFESVLKRLNGEEEEEKVDQALLHGFIRGEITESTIEEEQQQQPVVDEKAERRRRKEEKRRRKGLVGDVEQDAPTQAAAVEQQQTPEASSPNTTLPKTNSMGPRMAHRAKFRASKQMASLSSVALSEILGIAGSGSTTPNLNLTSKGTTSTPGTVASSSNAAHAQTQLPPPPTATGREDQLTTSTTSVADYFAAKMKARQVQLASGSQTPLDVEMASPEGEREEERPKEGKKEKKKRKRDVEEMRDTEEVVEAVEVIPSDEQPKRRKEKGVKESKKKRRKDVEGL